MLGCVRSVGTFDVWNGRGEVGGTDWEGGGDSETISSGEADIS